MEQNTNISPDASSADAADSPASDTLAAGHDSPPDDPAIPDPPPARIGRLDGHIPDIVDPLVPLHPDTSFTQTRRLRHDGWTPEKMRLFHERLAECGVVVEACEAAGMSARAAYNLRDRDPLFAAGWEAASLKARTRLADEVFSRSLNGVVDRIYKDGAIVAERHRYDNRLTMAALRRLDARLDRAEERASPHLALAARWEEYLAALGEGRREDGLALLAPEPEVHTAENAPDNELHEVCDDEEDEMESISRYDRHIVWSEGGVGWTDYPPPADFDGEEYGEYGSDKYKRTLAPAEQAVVDADEATDLAYAEAQRDAYFFGDVEESDVEPVDPLRSCRT